uniref:Uncharacterized protein n=1 Tax=Amphimedon queenslandica TaxID=400682 RepID=A0A1X7VVI8_AMPQE
MIMLKIIIITNSIISHRVQGVCTLQKSLISSRMRKFPIKISSKEERNLNSPLYDGGNIRSRRQL